MSAAAASGSEEANRNRWAAADTAWRGYGIVDGALWWADRVKVALALIEPAPRGAPAAMLDIGCATGVITRACADRFGATSVHGIDFVDVRSPELSAGRPPIAFQSHNLDGEDPLPFPDGSFDLVTCFETLEHLHDTDRMVAEIRRVLRPAGQAVLSVPRIDGLLSILMLSAGLQPPAVECSLARRYGSPDPEARVSGHVSNFTRRALHELLEAHGFDIVASRQASIYGDWRRAGKRPASQRAVLWCLSKVPIKQDVVIVSARRREGLAARAAPHPT